MKIHSNSPFCEFNQKIMNFDNVSHKVKHFQYFKEYIHSETVQSSYYTKYWVDESTYNIQNVVLGGCQFLFYNFVLYNRAVSLMFARWHVVKSCGSLWWTVTVFHAAGADDSGHGHITLLHIPLLLLKYISLTAVAYSFVRGRPGMSPPPQHSHAPAPPPPHIIKVNRAFSGRAAGLRLRVGLTRA